LAHIDPIGTVLLPLLLIPTGLLFAYAKPVPYNPYNLRNQRTGPVWVALAGPFSNVVLALVFGILARYGVGGVANEAFGLIAYANVMLFVFNLVPIPPLDGSKVLLALIPDSLWKLRQALEKFGFILLLVFILFFSGLLRPIVQAVYTLIVGVPSFF
jgi:Zn-dependent protease